MSEKNIVTIIVGDDCVLEAIAIRGCLEYLGFTVIFRLIGRPNDLVKILRNDELTGISSYLIFCFHGQAGKFLMPKLSEDIYQMTEQKGNFSYKQIAKLADLNGQHIIVTGCTLGQKKLAESFLECNAKTYVGANGYPDGNSVLIFVNTLFYFLSQGESYSKAFAKANNIDEETKMFEKYDKEIPN